MTFFKYISCFDEGTLFNIRDNGVTLCLFLESGAVDRDFFFKRFRLSKDNTIQGILYLGDVQKVMIDGQLTQRPLKMSYAEGEILSLKIEEMKLFLLIEWEPCFLPKDAGHAVTKIEIEAGKIYWKNVRFPEQNGNQVFNIENYCMEIEGSCSRIYPHPSD